MTFSKRLKNFIDAKGISQAEAARRCGIAQQSMHYILKNDLPSSKLGPQIAEALNINPEWLIYGEGRPEITLLTEIPIIHSPYMLKKYLNNQLSKPAQEFIVINNDLGSRAFAYLVKPYKMAICADNTEKVSCSEYLTLRDNEVIIAKKFTGTSFPIFEWRQRSEDF